MEITPKLKITIWVLLLSNLFFIASSFGQEVSKEQFFLVQFIDKPCYTNCTVNESHLFSEQGLARKNKFQITISENDYPIEVNYLNRLTTEGFQLVQQSKWLNAVVVKGITLPHFDCIKSVHEITVTKHIDSKVLSRIPDYSVKALKNGLSQLEGINLAPHNGQFLDSIGAYGEGIKVAVLDGGFLHLRDSLVYRASQSRVIEEFDLVNHADAYLYSDHGTLVSTFITGVNFFDEAADSTVKIAAGASKADLGLFVTEDVATESVIEEMNWIRAAEIADSLGYDIVSSSLSYTEFDNAADNYTFRDLDGNTTLIAKGAQIATEKGMLVVISAGNYADDPWYYIGSPADAKDVLTVGAINHEGVVAPFSSRGPTADGRIKPEVMAIGWGATSVNAFGNVVNINGTSFSCPFTSGLAAALWGQFPNLSAADIREALILSSDNVTKPNNDYGYGVPQMPKAHELLYQKWLDDKGITTENVVFPNPAVTSFSIGNIAPNEILNLKVFNELGKKLYNRHSPLKTTFSLNEVGVSGNGVYFVWIETNAGRQLKRLVVAR